MTWRETSVRPYVVERIGMLKASVNFRGRARMKGAEHLFWSMETADLSDQGLPREIPQRRYFGRVIAVGGARYMKQLWWSGHSVEWCCIR